MFEFKFESPLILEETFKDYVMVEATLLTEGRSTKGYLYTVDDANFNMVAETAVGKPIYHGINVVGEHKAPKLKGVYLKGHSGIFDENAVAVGKVVKSWFDILTRKVKAKLKIWDKDLIHRIKKGFKVSVRGVFDRFKNVIHKGQNAMKVFGLKIKDIQLVEPSTKVGVRGAQVEKVLEETMSFENFGVLGDVGAVVGQLIADGEI